MSAAIGLKIIAMSGTVSTSQDLFDFLLKIQANGIRLSEVYINSTEHRLSLIQESLSDGSLVFDIEMDENGDPNS